MTFGNPLPWWALLSCTALAVLVAVRAYAGRHVPLTAPQRRGLVALRLGTLLLLLAFLMRPMVVGGPGRRSDAVVPVLVDVSRSMALAGEDGQSRLARAQAIVAKLEARLSARFQVDRLSFGEELAEVPAGDLEPVARLSDLSGALDAVRERYPGRTIAGVVVVSDGGDTAREEASGRRALEAPVYAVGVGSRRILRDREVASLSAGDAPLADSVVDLTARIVVHGSGGAPADVTVRENGRLIQVRSIVAREDGSPVTVVFPVSPGRDTATLYTVEVAETDGEITFDNNRRSVLVQPPGRRRRILLVEGQPGFEHSFLKRALAGDPGLDVDAVVRKGRTERGEATFYVQAAATRSAALVKGYPAARAALFGYDAIVLANVAADALTRDQQTLTTAFVSERGGGLLVMGGRSFDHQALLRTPLEDLVPVELTDRVGLAVPVARWSEADDDRLVLTPDGERHPVMQLGPTTEETRRRWREAPALAAAAPIGGPRPGATVLAESVGAGGVARPIVAVEPFGEGRTMAFAGEASWRWRMLLPGSNHLYETFWRQAVRWLAGSSPDPLTMTLPHDAIPGEEVSVGVRARDAEFMPVPGASILMTVAPPGEPARRVYVSPVDAASGQYAGRFRAETSGVYTVHLEARRGDVSLGETNGYVLVGGADAEMSDPRLNDGVLRRIATASGGALLEEGDLDRLADRLAARSPGWLPPAPRDLWHHAWSFLLIVGLLTAEWTLRRRWGLR
jgi:uncharacterized membrane protein